MPAVTAKLPPEQAKAEATKLYRQLNEQEEIRNNANRKIAELNSKIYEVQANCPHQNTIEKMMLDVNEYKNRTICTDCNAYV